VPPGATQSLPREITFNPVTRQLQQAPIEELKDLRGDPITKAVSLNNNTQTLGLKDMAYQSELVVSFAVPESDQLFGVVVGNASSTKHASTYMNDTNFAGNDYRTKSYPLGSDPKLCQHLCNKDKECLSWVFLRRGQGMNCILKNKVVCPTYAHGMTGGVKVAQDLQCASTDALDCTIDFKANTNASAPFYGVAAKCNQAQETLRLLPSEKFIEFRMFLDSTFAETFFQQGRVAMTNNVPVKSRQEDVSLHSTGAVDARVTAYPMSSIWVTPQEVRNTKRIYSYNKEHQRF